MEEGLPRTELQHEIFGPDGRPVPRVDVIFDEKLREDAVRELALQVVRWIWRDLYRAGVIRDRVFRAFARASRRHLPHLLARGISCN